MLLLLLERKQNLSLCFPQRKIVPSSEAKFKTFLLPLYLLSPTESQIHQLKPTVSMNFKHPSPNFITQDLFLSDFAFFFSSELNHSFIMSQFLLNKYCTLWRYETGPQSLQFESPCLHRFSWSWPPSGISSLTILHLCPQSYVHGTSPSSSSFQALRKRWPRFFSESLSTMFLVFIISIHFSPAPSIILWW